MFFVCFSIAAGGNSLAPQRQRSGAAPKLFYPKVNCFGKSFFCQNIGPPDAMLHPDARLEQTHTGYIYIYIHSRGSWDALRWIPLEKIIWKLKMLSRTHLRTFQTCQNWCWNRFDKCIFIFIYIYIYIYISNRSDLSSSMYIYRIVIPRFTPPKSLKNQIWLKKLRNYAQADLPPVVDRSYKMNCGCVDWQCGTQPDHSNHIFYIHIQHDLSSSVTARP